MDSVYRGWGGDEVEGWVGGSQRWVIPYYIGAEKRPLRVNFRANAIDALNVYIGVYATHSNNTVVYMHNES